MAQLQQKVAVVTGGGRGIGAAIAEQLAAMGAAVVIAGRTEGPLRKTAEKIKAGGGKCLPLPCDVSQLASVESLAAEVKQHFGKLHILVNNAGVGSFSTPLHELKPAEWDRMMNTNLRGVYYCMRSFVPLLIAAGGGDIVNISSLAGKNPVPNAACYAATKWGLNGLSVSAAEELRGKNIRVSTVCPGSTNTEISGHIGKNAERMLQPADVAHVVGMIVTQAPQSFASEVLLRPTQKP